MNIYQLLDLGIILSATDIIISKIDMISDFMMLIAKWENRP